MKYVWIALVLFYTVEAKDIILGVVPQQSPLKMIQRWSPVAKYLSNATGMNIVFKPEASIPKFEEKLYKGVYDIAYMNPYHYVMSYKNEEYRALVRANKNIQGILVGRKELSALDREIFSGKTFLFPAPYAFAATLLIKYELKKKLGLDIEKESMYRYVNSHDSVYKGIQREIGDFGGGIVRTFNAIKNGDNDLALKILYKTKAYPSHPIAIHPRLNMEERELLRKALLSMPENILKTLGIKRMIKTQNSEYNSIIDLAKKLKIY